LRNFKGTLPPTAERAFLIGVRSLWLFFIDREEMRLTAATGNPKGWTDHFTDRLPGAW
jgi:hypothetical protein